MSFFGCAFGKSRAAKSKAAKKGGVITADSSYEEYAVTGPESEQQLAGSDDGSMGSESSEGLQRLFIKQGQEKDKVVGVVVTISQGSSYDENFRQIEPRTVPGERVSTYSMQCCDVGKLHQYLSGNQQAPAAPSLWAELLQDIRSVAPDSVTLNWECCSACSDEGFPLCSGMARSSRQGRSFFCRPQANASPTMQLMGLAVRRGYTVMCSDFSLKALISEWSEEHLGPNPFVKVAQECNTQFQLDFVPSDLTNDEVPQQLQVVGELCAEQGKAIVAAMGGTIVYTVNPRRARTDLYSLKVLTVVSDWSGDRAGHRADHRAGHGSSMPEAIKCSVGSGDGEKRGAAGHVTLTYASGGQLLTSMGHWIELSRLDTSLEAVLRAARNNFGEEEVAEINDEWNRLESDFDRQDCMQKWSKAMVQKSVPTRMKCRTKFG